MLRLTSEIEKFLYPRTENFLGCWNIKFIDQFVGKIQSKPVSSIIINNGHNHWIGLIICEKYSIYFDSLGLSIKHKWERRLYKKLLDFTRKCFPSIQLYYYNRIRIQSKKSKECGKFSAIFILLVIDKKTFHNFLRLFCIRNRNVNDYIVTTIVNMFEIQ